MAPRKHGQLPSLRRQHLCSEFAGLKQACPEGVFVSITTTDSALWSAVLFVRDGPYAPAVMRFHVSFPDAYPLLPPLVTFANDIFHPLITPLTTYMYTTDVQDNGTVSASDSERLPPGGFSLRHGFPQWYGRGKRTISGNGVLPAEQDIPDTPAAAADTTPIYLRTKKEEPQISVYQILRYIKSAFDQEEILDSVPLKAAGNPGAWHAWRSHRRKLGQLQDSDDEPPPVPEKETKAAATAEHALASPGKRTSQQPQASREPGEWNWEGVWEDRVKKGVAASLSESVLYGNANNPDDLIQFLAMDQNEADAVKERILGEAV